MVSFTFAADHTFFTAAESAVSHSFSGARNWAVVLLPSPPLLIIYLSISPRFDRDGVLFVGPSARKVECDLAYGALGAQERRLGLSI